MLRDDNDAGNMKQLATNLLVGVGNPYALIFYFPNDCKENVSCLIQEKNGGTYVGINLKYDVCEEIVRAIISHLQQYIVLDDSLKMVDLVTNVFRVYFKLKNVRKLLDILSLLKYPI